VVIELWAVEAFVFRLLLLFILLNQLLCAFLSLIFLCGIISVVYSLVFSLVCLVWFISVLFDHITTCFGLYMWPSSGDFCDKILKIEVTTRYYGSVTVVYVVFAYYMPFD
jgi:hypothetical protein